LQGIDTEDARIGEALTVALVEQLVDLWGQQGVQLGNEGVRQLELALAMPAHRRRGWGWSDDVYQDTSLPVYSDRSTIVSLYMLIDGTKLFSGAEERTLFTTSLLRFTVSNTKKCSLKLMTAYELYTTYFGLHIVLSNARCPIVHNVRCPICTSILENKTPFCK
jgi:hypothetical protein